jgi:pSer/pThr/pTyr-binding forkhead associated (FHA) protein
MEGGREFEFAADRETLIGRADPVTGIQPTVDLTAIDTQRSCSRRHARLFRRGGRLYLVEEVGSMNGTFVNGRRLDTGVPVEVQPGDVLRFGVLKLELRPGESP